MFRNGKYKIVIKSVSVATKCCLQYTEDCKNTYFNNNNNNKQILHALHKLFVVQNICFHQYFIEFMEILIISHKKLKLFL